MRIRNPFDYHFAGNAAISGNVGSNEIPRKESANEMSRKEIYEKINDILKPDFFIKCMDNSSEIFDFNHPHEYKGELFLRWNNDEISIRGPAVFGDAIKRLEAQGFEVNFEDVTLWQAVTEKLENIFKLRYSLVNTGTGCFEIHSKPEKSFQFPTSEPDAIWYRTETLNISIKSRFAIMNIIYADEFEDIKKKMEEEGFRVFINSSDSAEQLKKYQRQV